MQWYGVLPLFSENKKAGNKTENKTMLQKWEIIEGKIRIFLCKFKLLTALYYIRLVNKLKVHVM
jgi:hypothetical protein